MTPSDSVKVVPQSYWRSAQLGEDLRWCQCLVVHYMTQGFAWAIAAAPPSVCVVWSGWGGDYYHLLPGYADALYLPETRRIVSRLPKRRTWNPREVIHHLLHAALAPLLPRWERDVLQRIDVVSMLPSEYRMLSAAQPGLRARHHHLHYSSAEDVLLRGAGELHGNDVLVGNSASPANNHAEAFACLRRLDLEERRIVVPLSYEDRHYADEICRIGTKLFGARFVPLRRFMPLDEYNKTIAGCSLVLMNHIRQQGNATIITALYRGARVFLRRENPLLAFYRGLGLRVEEITELDAAARESLGPLPIAQAEENRRTLRTFYRFERIVDAARELTRFIPPAHDR